MNDVIDLLIILDRSGSMQDRKADHEGGLRSFVSDQKSLEGDVRLTLVQFDTADPCEVVIDRKPIAEIDEATISLLPRGGTPLLDAIGKATAHLEKLQLAVPSGRTICLIITDGYENASTEWTKDRVKSKIAALETNNWTVLFLGANIDAFSEAASLGIQVGTTASMPNVATNIRSGYGTFSNKIAAVRSMTTAGTATRQSVSLVMTYTTGEREDIAVGNSVTFDGGAKLVQEAEKEEKEVSGPHPSHVTRISMGASSYDEICVNCGATDKVPGGWGRLAYPCPNPPRKGENDGSILRVRDSSADGETKA